MRLTKYLFISIIIVTLNGCSSSIDQIEEMTWLELGGTLGGAVLGGYTGSQIGAGIGQVLYMTTGVLVGGSTGYAVSRTLGPSDRAYYRSRIQKALADAADGEIIHWKNPETGRDGIFRAVNSYTHLNGQQCRKYRASVVFNDGVYSGGGIACQIANGTWFKSFDEFS